MASKKKTQLIMASLPLSCPDCKRQCVLVSADGDRIVVKHPTIPVPGLDCQHEKKIWMLKQPTIGADEI
jgi:hypothetical protein